jgi:hypothetical protein
MPTSQVGNFDSSFFASLVQESAVNLWLITRWRLSIFDIRICFKHCYIIYIHIQIRWCDVESGERRLTLSRFGERDLPLFHQSNVVEMPSPMLTTSSSDGIVWMSFICFRWSTFWRSWSISQSCKSASVLALMKEHNTPQERYLCTRRNEEMIKSLKSSNLKTLLVPALSLRPQTSLSIYSARAHLDLPSCLFSSLLNIFLYFSRSKPLLLCHRKR